MIRIIRPRICDIIQYLFSVQSIALRNGQETHGTESAFSINVQTLAFPATHAYGKLAGHGEGVTELGLARAELTKKLSDRTSLDAACPYNSQQHDKEKLGRFHTAKQSVELLGARRNVHKLRSTRMYLRRALKTKGDDLLRCNI
jgi:hypothetical protein